MMLKRTMKKTIVMAKRIGEEEVNSTLEITLAKRTEKAIFIFGALSINLLILDDKLLPPPTCGMIK